MAGAGETENEAERSALRHALNELDARLDKGIEREPGARRRFEHLGGILHAHEHVVWPARMELWAWATSVPSREAAAYAAGRSTGMPDRALSPGFSHWRITYTPPDRA